VKPKSTLTEWFNSLPLLKRLRAYVNAAEALKGEARNRALQECAHLRGQIAAHNAAIEARQEPRQRYSRAIATGDSETAAKIAHEHPEAIRSAAAPSPGVVKSITPDSFAGIGGSKPKDKNPLNSDAEYQRALDAGDSEALARIAHNFGRKK
jgi:hypothetical protein